MAETRTPSPLHFGSQWSSWVLIAAVLLLLVALILYL
jgi:uncharacterized membrane protein